MNMHDVTMKKYQLPNRAHDTRPALCLDLDGTIRYSASGDFINSTEDIRLYEDVESALWKYRNDGFLIYGVTNQGGVAYGHKTESDHNLEIYQTGQLFDKNPFHAIFAAFCHPNGDTKPYNKRSFLRKPEIGMLALCETHAWSLGYIIDWDKSIMVGDRQEDKELAERGMLQFYWADRFFGRGK